MTSKYSNEQIGNWKKQLKDKTATYRSIAAEMGVSHISIYHAINSDIRRAYHQRWYAKKIAQGTNPYRERKKRFGDAYVVYEHKLRDSGVKGLKLKKAMKQFMEDKK